MERQNLLCTYSSSSSKDTPSATSSLKDSAVPRRTGRNVCLIRTGVLTCTPVHRGKTRLPCPRHKFPVCRIRRLRERYIACQAHIGHSPCSSGTCCWNKASLDAKGRTVPSSTTGTCRKRTCILASTAGQVSAGDMLRECNQVCDGRSLVCSLNLFRIFLTS